MEYGANTLWDAAVSWSRLLALFIRWSSPAVAPRPGRLNWGRCHFSYNLFESLAGPRLSKDIPPRSPLPNPPPIKWDLCLLGCACGRQTGNAYLPYTGRKFFGSIMCFRPSLASLGRRSYVCGLGLSLLLSFNRARLRHPVRVALADARPRMHPSAPASKPSYLGSCISIWWLCPTCWFYSGFEPRRPMLGSQ